MKIALGQINTTVGAVKANTAKVLETIERARAEGADLVVFPELALTGYPPLDLIEHSSFIDANLDALETVAAATAAEGSPGVIVGFVDRRDGQGEAKAGGPSTGQGGKMLYNAAALIDGGRVLSRHYKSLLPTYDVFDELRYFHPAESVRMGEFRGTKIAITICEDFWNDELYWERRQYKFDPVAELGEQKPDLMITIAASPFAIGKQKIRDDMYSLATRRYGVPLIHVNLVGGNDSLIFDGRSDAWSSCGERVQAAKCFAEDFRILDVEALDEGPALKHAPSDKEERLYAALKLGVADYVRKCGFEKVLIGLSGGIDSALTATIAVDALGTDAVTGVGMPSEFSSTGSVDDARELAKNLGIDFHVLPIKPIYDRFLETLDPLFKGLPFGVAEENIQARSRGNLLMALSNKFGWLVLTTGNKSEMAVGYCTLYGDMTGGLAVISDLLKTRVFALSRWVNRNGERIPANTIEKPPSAELRPDQLDTDSLPPYDVLDPIVEAYIEKHKHAREIIAEGYDAEVVERVMRMIDRNEYKRHQAPPGLKVTGKAFGYGRRMPIARGDWND